MNFFSDERVTYGPLPNIHVLITYMPQVACTCELLPSDGDHGPFLTQTGTWRGEVDDEPPYGGLFGKAEDLWDAFQEITTPEEAQQFLAHCGPWLRPKDSTQYEPHEQDQQHMFWADFQKWQSFFRAKQLEQPTNVGYLPGTGLVEFGRPHANIHEMKAAPRRVGLSDKPGMHLWVTCQCAAEAIAAIIETDLLTGITHRECVNTSCRKGRGGKPKIFRVGYREEKKCCDDKCLHVVGQRARRQEKRKSRLPAKTTNRLSKNTKAKGPNLSPKPHSIPAAPADPSPASGRPRRVQLKPVPSPAPPAPQPPAARTVRPRRRQSADR